MAAHRFSIQLIMLRCVKASGIDGDRIYLKFGSQIIWSSGSVRMHPRPFKGSQGQQIDFVSRTSGGVAQHDSIGVFPLEIQIPNSPDTGTRFELWKRRRLMRDQRLGIAPISVGDTEHGVITVVFTGDAAQYALSYCIRRCQPDSPCDIRVRFPYRR